MLEFQIRSFFEDREESADYDIWLEPPQHFIHVKNRWNQCPFVFLVVFILGKFDFEVKQRFDDGHWIRKSCIDDAVSFVIVSIVHY